MNEIAQKTGFKLRTLYDWKAKLKKDSNYNPLNPQVRLTARYFTEEEDGITDFIWREYLIPCKCFNDNDCIEIITNAYLEKHRDDEEIDIEFTISNGYIYNFKNRHGFVSKLCHLKRRPKMKQKLIDSFIDDMIKLFDSVVWDRIINIDETAVFLAPKDLKIWHSRGMDDVTIPVRFNDKERITAVCAIGADGFKYPIQFIAKGKTSEVLNTQIGDVAPNVKAFSENGWTTQDTFYEYLSFIRSNFDDDKEIHIILDVYSAHRTDKIKESAKALGIVLHFIPAGFTDIYKPLDVKIFAMIKAYLKHMIRLYLRDDEVMNKQMACKLMIRDDDDETLLSSIKSDIDSLLMYRILYKVPFMSEPTIKKLI